MKERCNKKKKIKPTRTNKTTKLQNERKHKNDKHLRNGRKCENDIKNKNTKKYLTCKSQPFSHENKLNKAELFTMPIQAFTSGHTFSLGIFLVCHYMVSKFSYKTVFDYEV